MKAFAAILAIALCSSGILVQGGIVGDIGNGLGDGLGNVVNVALNLVQGLLENLVKVLSGLTKILPNVAIDANTSLNNVQVQLGNVEVGFLEDQNILDLKVDNVSLLISDLNIDAEIAITNLNVPGVLENASITDNISIQARRISVSVTVEVTIGSKGPIVSDVLNLEVTVDAAVAVAANIKSDVLDVVLGTNLPLTVAISIGRHLQENKQALIDLVNNRFL